MALRRLQLEYKEYLDNISPYYSLEPSENFYNWKVLLFGPLETIYDGGVFECSLIFTHEYPYKPPELIFNTKLIHPNIFPNGKMCISILHEGEDISSYEHISERWNPSQSINSILLSVLSILIEPNLNSPANIDINNMYKNNYNEYKKLIYHLIAKQ